MKNKLKLPKFRSRKKEEEFWSKIDLSKYFEPDDFELASLPDLKPSSRAISLRVPEYLLIRIKEQANELNIPYQSLMKKYIAQGALRKSK